MESWSPSCSHWLDSVVNLYIIFRCICLYLGSIPWTCWTWWAQRRGLAGVKTCFNTCSQPLSFYLIVLIVGHSEKQVDAARNQHSMATSVVSHANYCSALVTLLQDNGGPVLDEQQRAGLNFKRKNWDMKDVRLRLKRLLKLKLMKENVSIC